MKSVATSIINIARRNEIRGRSEVIGISRALLTSLLTAVIVCASVALVGLTTMVTAQMLSDWGTLPLPIRSALKPLTYLTLTETTLFMFVALRLVPLLGYAPSGISGGSGPGARRFFVILGYMFIPILFTAVAAFGAEPVSNDVCLSCHSVPGLEKERQGKKVSLSVDAQRFSKSAHGPLPCTACHSDVTQIPHAPELKPVQCAQCHPKVAEIYAGSVHGRASMNGDGDAAKCSSCHGKHDIFPVTSPQAKVYPLQLPYTCGGCHGDPALAKKHNIPVANAYKLYMDSIHGQALEKSGLLVAANCSSCHGSHDIRPKQDPKSKVNRANVPATCGACHVGILDDYFDGVHGRAVKQGNSAAPVCVDCHTTHEIRRVETADWKLDIIKECGTCHRESLRTYRDTFHGQVTSLGFVRVARCSDCHGSHKILRRSDPRSSIAPARLVSTCQKCHSKANIKFAQFSPHADYSDKQRNPGLYYAAIFMKILLTGVFVFFGLHTCLWLFRSIIDVWGRKRPG